MSQSPEPVLVYQPDTDQWRGTNGCFSIWMDDRTFRAYVASWYEWEQWLPGLSPENRYAAAVAHCQRVNYWFGCERNYDRRVHITYH